MTGAEAAPLERFVYGGTWGLGGGLSHRAESLLEDEKFNCF